MLLFLLIIFLSLWLLLLFSVLVVGGVVLPLFLCWLEMFYICFLSEYDWQEQHQQWQTATRKTTHSQKIIEGTNKGKNHMGDGGKSPAPHNTINRTMQTCLRQLLLFVFVAVVQFYLIVFWSFLSSCCRRCRLRRRLRLFYSSLSFLYLLVINVVMCLLVIQITVSCFSEHILSLVFWGPMNSLIVVNLLFWLMMLLLLHS